MISSEFLQSHTFTPADSSVDVVIKLKIKSQSIDLNKAEAEKLYSQLGLALNKVAPTINPFIIHQNTRPLQF